MDLQFRGRRALVTGSTAGIGFAIAVGLAREGAQVIVNGRTRERVQQAVQEIRAQTISADLKEFAGDLSKPEAIEQLIHNFPDVDILINNLGIFEPKNFPDITDHDWERLWQTNVMSGVRLSRHYLPRMLQVNWGRIIFISSESAVNIPAEMIHYGVTKTAQVALARGMAETTAGTAVTVNTVLAGPTMSEGVTEWLDKVAQSRKMSKPDLEREFFQSMRPSSLLKRFATPEEVANMVVFLASPLASATNGAAVRAEGGLLRSIL
jgi:NAD(P)-dependent dehydrogenase (short-subunit alcohol dehydrogenase family)